MYAYHVCTSCSQRSERVSYPLKLEWLTFVSHHSGLWRRSKCSNTLSHCSSPRGHYPRAHLEGCDDTHRLQGLECRCLWGRVCYSMSFNCFCCPSRLVPNITFLEHFLVPQKEQRAIFLVLFVIKSLHFSLAWSHCFVVIGLWWCHRGLKLRLSFIH